MTQTYWIPAHLFVPLTQGSQAYPGTLAVLIYLPL